MSESRSKIAILTDSNNDLPVEILARYPIYPLPLILTVGGKQYLDGVTITPEEVYERQKTEDFKTSLPDRGDAEALLTRILQDGYTQVIVLVLSTGLSGTVNLLRLIAEERKDLEIAVFDTHSGSLGVGALALQAAQYAEQGLSFEEIKELMPQLIEDTYPYFSINTMEYLKRGGRVGRTTAAIGTMLQIKPIISFDEEGVLTAVAKVRGRSAVKGKLIELIQERAAENPGLEFNLMVCDGGCPEEAVELQKELAELFPEHRQFVHGHLGCTLAVHTGPGLLGAAIQFLRRPSPVSLR